MDLEPCFKVHNLVVIHLNSTKLGQVPNLKVAFCVVASIYQLDNIYNLTHSPVQPQSGLNTMSHKYGKRMRQGKRKYP